MTTTSSTAATRKEYKTYNKMAVNCGEIRMQGRRQQSSGTARFLSSPNIMAVMMLLLLPVAVQAKTCLIMYQMADNNLEYYIRQDYEELTASGMYKRQA